MGGPVSPLVDDGVRSRQIEVELYTTKFLVPCLADFFTHHFRDSLLRRYGLRGAVPSARALVRLTRCCSTGCVAIAAPA